MRNNSETQQVQQTQATQEAQHTQATSELLDLIQQTVKQYVSPVAQVANVDSEALKLGFQAIGLYRHKVSLTGEGVTDCMSLITKQATAIERRVLARLFDQAANVPYSQTFAPDSAVRSLICIEDVDAKTDYQNLDLPLLHKQEINGLAYIHHKNLGAIDELSWLPSADQRHIEAMIAERWRPSWQSAKTDEAFIAEFGAYIPNVEAAAQRATRDMEAVLQDESSYTLIHNDLNPGNVLVHNNNDVFFIDWEEARYGSLYLDVPLRCETQSKATAYREALENLGTVIPQAQFEQYHRIATRYLALRFMTWNLNVWKNDDWAKTGLQKYLEMAVS
ncbi:hypothetical protein EBB07_24785 [Paenibacillaceae bacterium]|nr:hypothetical protein EBB07_24785 [Paenibacillaceae bacterium]